ncbi:MAG TPA: cytochrome b/b6 domain-containing protein [Nevskiaceae bacterium]|nr:cytochrome b/b6 domain-containing protein [Nevskiaceae bacterium]
MAATASLDRTTRLLHLGIAVFGVWAWLVGAGIIGAGARDYNRPDHLWYTQHEWVGIVFAAFLFARIAWGLIGPSSARFTSWIPWNRARCKLVGEDIRSLLHFKLPERPAHAGLSGCVQALGLLVFLWLAVSGLISAVTITPGTQLTGWPHGVKHWHQIGVYLIPAYLTLHVGATLLHSLAGRPIWKKMLFLE